MNIFWKAIKVACPSINNSFNELEKGQFLKSMIEILLWSIGNRYITCMIYTHQLKSISVFAFWVWLKSEICKKKKINHYLRVWQKSSKISISALISRHVTCAYYNFLWFHLSFMPFMRLCHHSKTKTEFA